MIEGFVGLIGAGKSMLAVKHAAEIARKRGQIVASNISLSIPGVECRKLAVGHDGIDIEEVWRLFDLEEVPLEDGRTLLRRRAGSAGLVLVLDEVGVLMPARFWASAPIDLMQLLSQSRKLGCDLVWTAQDVEQVDAFLRRLTQWIYKCQALPTPTTDRRERGRRPWFYAVGTWRPATVDKTDKRIRREFTRYNRRWEGWYDTDEIVRPAARIADKQRAKRGSGVPSAVVATPASGGDPVPALIVRPAL